MFPSWLASVHGLFARRFGRRRLRSLARPDSRANRIPEPLEQRRVMAFDIVAAFAQSDTPFFVTGQPAATLTESPQQITLRFNSGVKIDPTTLGAITVARAGSDGVVGNGNDVNVTPASGVGIVAVDDFPNENQVVLRFADNLPDDLYRITIGGGLKTLAGGPSAPADSFRGGNPFSINVRLDLGAQVVAVVPQPISRVGATTALQQALDTVDVYFNANDPLQAGSASNPRNYRLVETDPATGGDVAVQIPQAVTYDATAGRAILTFAAPLGDKLYRLQVGGSDDDNGTVATAVRVGTLFAPAVGTGPSFITNSFLGDGTAAANDVDLYKVSLAAAGTLTFTVTPAAGFTPALRLFDSAGAEITTGVDASVPNTLTYAAPAAGTFHIGISSTGNIAYNPATGSGATGGTSRGGYRLEISSTVAVPTADPGGTNTNSSFTTATGLGTLGLAGQAFNASIDVLPFIPTPVFPLGFPSSPGTIDEPGHREIQLPTETHAMPAGTVNLAQAARVQAYAFPNVYGVDGQGNPLRNVIDDNQKQRAREVFELYSRATGIRFVEVLTYTPDTGVLAVVTGDVRAVDPSIPFGAVDGICGIDIVVMNSTKDWKTSEYGGDWQRTAMHEIGHFLGLGHSYDLTSVMSRPDDAPTVLPGDYDLQHLSVLNPALGTDIDVYSFQIDKDGTLTAETVVARPGQAAASPADTVLTLYREDPATGQRELIARNDDYFARDSFLGLELKAAAPSTAKYTYYIAVTSTGNTAFNPEVENSGANGRTDGAYRLQLGFTPAGEASNTIVDTTGTPLDGDRDGLAGGAFHFWFRSSTATNTVYVDKLAASAGADGSLAKPFNTVAAGLAAAGGKAVVRIVGNASGAAATPYLVGTNLAGTQPLADGASFVVPAGVTVMIDAGAVLKFRSQVIDVGSSSQLISRAGAALQVLGTPGNRVQFTSYHDDSLGGNSDGVGPTVSGGQWGGIVFRQDSDSATKRVFLNSVSQANIRYGGGQVTINSKLQSIAPLHLETARPTLAFNDVRNSAGAAISADPNSFEESNGRTGPSIRGNVVRDNSLNGLLVRIRTEFGQPIDRLTVPARLASPDITYIVPENLFIAGGVGGYQTRILQKTGTLTQGSSTITGLANVTGLTAGMPVVGAGVPNGALIASVNSATNSITLSAAAVQSGVGVSLSFDTSIVEARASGRLAVDPGVVVKLQGSRIELERGAAQLYAEGTPQKRVIFTSTRDNRYGAGGTFVAVGTTANTPTAGNWGGIVVNDAATASIDNAVISFGGGQAPINGGFASFNTLSVDQGSLRLANSRFENNATGIFVVGAQPVIAGNDFRTNGGDLISVDANSLNSREVSDPGRSTGPNGRYAEYDGNRGPLVRGNRITAGGITGMVVRGDEITSESVWDDTDIVHVVRDEIFVSNFHAATGLRLMSSPTASLVVKFLGAAAGLTATGEPTDIDDRIGGTVQVIGQPGYPVIITSLADDTVGASLDPVGRTVTDTNGDGSGSAPIAGDWRGLRFLPYSNDRNVAVLRETEPAVSGGVEANAFPSTAQSLGVLAPHESGGDDNRRLGFEVHGAIAYDSPTDIDVYSFSGYVGSEVWIDIDYSSSGLDAMVELLDEAGTVLARSVDLQTDELLSSTTLVGALPFLKNEVLGTDLLSTNPRDPGMRVVLPGATAGVLTNYAIRVRSQPRTAPNAPSLDYQARLRDADFSQPGDQVDQGATSGSYQVRVRLRQLDEKPGSTVRYADIRYPVVGVDVQGLPQRSPLAGDTAETSQPNDTRETGQYVGNLLASDLNTISIAGSILSADDVDWYALDLDYEQIQAIGGVNGGGKTFATVFDIDYADGFRGDLTLSVFDSLGRLIFVGRDSNVTDDQPLSGQPVFADMSRGSAGTLDPFIGPVHLPAGLPGSSQRYYVAVSSNERLPAVLDMTFKSAATNASIRLEPVNSVSRLIEDRIGFLGYHSGEQVTGKDSSDYTFVAPIAGPLFSLPNLNSQLQQFSFNDIDRYVSWRPDEDETAVVPGALLADDLAMRTDGRLYTYAGVANGVNTAGTLKWVSISGNAAATVGNDNIPNFPANVEPTELTDADATATTKAPAATVTTFALDAQGAQAGKVQLANVKGTLQYTFTPIGETLPRTGSWTFASDAAGAITFAPAGVLPPNTPLPADTISTVSDEGTLSVTWLDGGSGAQVVVSGLAMTNVAYMFEPEVPPESVTTDRVDAVVWHRKSGAVLNYDKLYYSVRDVDPLTTDPVTKAFVETGVSRLYNGDTISGAATDPTEDDSAPGGRIGTVIQTAGGDLGLTTGMAFLGDTLYGVDNLGHLFTIDTDTAVATLLGWLPGKNLQGLANGPQNITGGPSDTPGYFADKLFAIDDDGFLFCLDPAAVSATPGPLSPLPVFPNSATGQNDATSRYLGAVNPTTGANVLTGAVTGFAFSPVDVPLWRATGTRGSESGHGVGVAPDNTRDGLFTNNDADPPSPVPPESNGGASIYYGFDSTTGTAADGSKLTHFGVVSTTWASDLASGVGSSVADLPAPGMRPVSLDESNTFAGSRVVTVPTTRDLAPKMLVTGPGIPEGTRITSISSASQVTLSTEATETSTEPVTLTFRREAAITALPFSLAGYTYNDKPTLYFNYRIEAGAASTTVSLSTDNGANWITIAANVHDHSRSSLDTSDKTLPNFPSVSSAISTQPNQIVQELFEGAWRQARIDLGQFAGLSNIQVKFDFSATPLNGVRAEGVYFDDFIVGFAERGEMVTGHASGNTSFFDIDTPASFTVPQQNLQGEYQLEIRRGMEFGTLTSSVSKAVQILGDPNPPVLFPTPLNVLDTNARRIRGNLHPAATAPFAGFGGVAEGQNLRGDENTPRGQGQFIIEGNIVSHADEYGIRIDAGARDAETGASPMGAVKSTPTLNTGRLVPGVVIINNVVANTQGEAAILFSGDPNTGTGPSAPVSYGRIVNNTIYGGTVGVRVTENAAPTLLNNVFSSLGTGIEVDASAAAAGTVVGFSAFHATAPGVSGSNPVVLTTDPFVNAARGNFYPAANSLVIDSAVDVLQDRTAYTAITQPLGIPLSPIIAPGRDMFGQLRSDDPTQESPTGLGSDVFKDLGAIDRVDFVQPFAAIVVPLDGGSADKDPDTDQVRLEKADARGIAKFELQLGDFGVGIDKTTVVAEAFEVRRNGTLLVAGTDYSFNYLESSNRVAFEAAAVFPMGTYVISVVQAPLGGVPTNVITDLAGNPLLPNQADGTTTFSIEFADAPNAPTGLIATSGDGQATLTWNAAISDGTPLIRYQLQQATSDTFAGATNTDINDPAVVSTVVTGLVNGTAYWFRVRAVNSVGDSEWSNIAGPVVPITPPLLALGTGIANGAAAAEATQASGVVTVSGQNGAAIVVMFQRGAGSPVTKNLIGTGAPLAVVLTTADLATLGDGTISVSATQSIIAGAISAAATTSFTLDSAPPSAPVLTLGAGIANGASAAEATQASGVVTVSGETGAAIVVTFQRGAGTPVTKNLVGTGAPQAVVLTLADLATLGDGTIAVLATQTDAAGNPQTAAAATASFTLNTTPPVAPALALGTGISNGATALEATQASGVVTVSGENGAAIAVTFRRGAGTPVTKNLVGTGAPQAAVLTLADLATLGDGLISVSATQTNTFGNTSSPATTSFTLDATPPAAATLALGIGIANGATAIEATQASGVVTVSGENGAAIVVTFQRGAGTPVTKNLVGTGAPQAVILTNADLLTLGNGTILITAIQTDAVGNASTPATTSFTLDTAPPAAPALALVAGVANGATRAEATRAIGVVTVAGEAGATIVVVFQRGAGTPVTKTLVGTGARQPVVLTAADVTTLGNGLISVSATQTDAVGNAQAAAASTTSVTIDTVRPTVSNVTSSLPNGTYASGQAILIDVVFREPVLATGGPSLVLNTTPQRTATYVSGSGTTTLTFRYTVAAGDTAADLNYASRTALSGGKITDAAGNLAVATLPALAGVGSLATNKNIVIDGALQAVASGFSTTPDGPAFSTSVGSVPITFTAPVTGVSLTSFQLYYEGRAVSLLGATVTGSGTSYTLSLPATATNLRGRYRLDIGGPTSGIQSGGVTMTRATSIYWQRV